MSVTLLEKEKGHLFPSGEDDVGIYLQQIRAYPRLTPEQERELAKGCAAGDEESVRMLVSSNLRLVVSIAREYAGRGVPLLDLIQEGSIGLIAAARKFDYTLDYRFSTYATKWIRQGVARCVLNHAGLIRVPVHTAERIRKLMTARTSLQQRTGQEPTPQELAEQSGIPEKKVRQLLQLLPEVCSLDAPAGEGDEGSLQLLLEDEQVLGPQEALIRRELKQVLDALLGQLTPRQAQILRLHYGMEDGVCHSLEEIGSLLGISKERARQVEHQAMDKLRTQGTDLGLEDFLE